MRRHENDEVLPDPRQEPTIKITRAGQILGMSASSAYKAARDGRFPVTKISPTRKVVLTAKFLELYGLGESDD